MKTLKEYKKEQMKNPEFVEAYEEIQPEMSVIRAMIDARLSRGMTQKELAEATGIAQGEISKLENGKRLLTLLQEDFLPPFIICI